MDMNMEKAIKNTNIDKEVEWLKGYNYAMHSPNGIPSFVLEIKKVIFSNPATIVYWIDGTKTVVKAENEAFDPEKGLAMAIAKKAYGNKGNYYNNLKKHVRLYNAELLNKIRELHKQGKTEKEISDILQVGSVTKFRELKSKLLKEEGAK